MAYDAPLRRVLAIKGPTALSKDLGIVPSAITQWDRVPAKWLMRVAQITGIPMAELRPDLAPEPAQEGSDAAPRSDAA